MQCPQVAVTSTGLHQETPHKQTMRLCSTRLLFPFSTTTLLQWFMSPDVSLVFFPTIDASSRSLRPRSILALGSALSLRSPLPNVQLWQRQANIMGKARLSSIPYPLLRPYLPQKMALKQPATVPPLHAPNSSLSHPTALASSSPTATANSNGWSETARHSSVVGTSILMLLRRICSLLRKASSITI